MSLKARFFRGGLTLSAGYALQQALVFLRSVIIARLVGPDDFGIQVTFLILISALEMASDLGVEMYLIRAANGANPIVQNTLHTILAIRGLVLGLAIFFASDLTAWIFKVPEAAWAYRLLSVVSILRGFVHLDFRRMQREMIYFPTIVITLAGTVVSTIVALMLGYLLHSYEAMLWALVADAVATVVASHVVAKSRYRFGYSPAEFWSLLKYGAPLLLNGVVLFLMGQGDRSIIGSQMGVHELANYAVAAMLTSGPALLIIKVSGVLFVPLLSAHSPSSSAFARRYGWCGALTALSIVPIVILLVTYGQPVAKLFYGEKYDVSAFVMSWLAVAAGARILRFWPQAVALAVGSTRDVLVANALPVTGFFAALVALHFNYGAVGVATCVAAGEFFALVFALERGDAQTIQGRGEGRKLGLIFFFVSAASICTICIFPPAWTSSSVLIAAVTIMSLAAVSILYVSDPLRSWLLKSVQSIKDQRAENAGNSDS